MKFRLRCSLHSVPSEYDVQRLQMKCIAYEYKTDLIGLCKNFIALKKKIEDINVEHVLWMDQSVMAKDDIQSRFIACDESNPSSRNFLLRLQSAASSANSSLQVLIPNFYGCDIAHSCRGFLRQLLIPPWDGVCPDACARKSLINYRGMNSRAMGPFALGLTANRRRTIPGCQRPPQSKVRQRLLMSGVLCPWLLIGEP
ncbi:hypothetical protein CDAR_453981 [Caerostris darwini]|uniref:Uncharacterized protein n=1 Tax=Caerostris darwini TaxID=1538125 RepID=A0AAV4V7G0_9ARAC|nr:hypothetical protein CDAR_453981 [Caerostris darwini]